MIEFLRKFENRGIKITRVNSTSESINLQVFTLILYGVGVRCDRRPFSLLSPFIEKSIVIPINISHLIKKIVFLFVELWIHIHFPPFSFSLSIAA